MVRSFALMACAALVLGGTALGPLAAPLLAADDFLVIAHRGLLPVASPNRDPAARGQSSRERRTP